jgi:hypothetical protein
MSDAEIIITPDGTTARHIHSDELTAMTAELGDQTIRRASNVEPTSELSPLAVLTALGGEPPKDAANYAVSHATTESYRERLPAAWWADMYPVGGPVLGPFGTRQLALDEEVKWLREHNIPTCETCGNNDNSNDGTTDGDPTSD